jgi:hypothetical protein
LYVVVNFKSLCKTEEAFVVEDTEDVEGAVVVEDAVEDAVVVGEAILSLLLPVLVVAVEEAAM